MNIPLVTTICFSLNLSVFNWLLLLFLTMLSYWVREKIVIFLWRRDPKEFEQESHKALKVETFERGESWRGWEYSKATTVQQLNSKDFILNNVRKENIIRLWLWMRNFLQEKSAHNETTAQTSKNSLPLSAGCPFSYSIIFLITQSSNTS